MVPEARVVHAMAGRVRLRVPARKGDAAYFAQIERTLGEAPGVVEVTTNPLTGSILVVHQNGADAVLRVAQEQDLFREAPPTAAMPSVLDLASGGVSRLEQKLGGATQGQVDLYDLAFTGLVGAAAVQALRGRLLGPASAFLSYAVAILVAYRSRRNAQGTR